MEEEEGSKAFFILFEIGGLHLEQTEILSLFVFVIVVHFEFSIQNVVSQLNNCFAIGIEAFDSSRKTSTRSQIKMLQCMAVFEEASERLDTHCSTTKVQFPEIFNEVISSAISVFLLRKRS